MEETNTNRIAGIATVDAMEAAIGTFRRRPSNLLQCMDQDGNIDAFRYIEYSRQRRMEFLKRADFICKMKSTLRIQHHQQLHRSASLPGMTALSAVPSIPSMVNEIFTGTHAGSVSPETTGSIAFSNTPQCLAAGRCNNSYNNNTRTALPAVPAATRLMARSASMPFVSCFGTNAKINNTGIDAGMTQAATTYIGSTSTNCRNLEFETHFSVSRPPQRRRLRKEEFEAAEALLFGMGRGSTPACETGSSKRNDGSVSEDDDDDTTDVEAEDEDQSCVGNHHQNKTTVGVSSKKRKISDLPRGGILSRSEEMESILSVVSAEEENSNNNSNSNVQEEEDIAATHGFASLGRMK